MQRVAAAALSHKAGQSPSSWNRTTLANARVLQTPLCPSTREAESGGIEPLALRLRLFSKQLGPQAHAIQAESKGIEPSALRLARFSRPLAHHCALPSSAPTQGFEPQLPSPEPGVLPLDEVGKARPVGVEPTTARFGDERLAASRTQVVGEEGVEPS